MNFTTTTKTRIEQNLPVQFKNKYLLWSRAKIREFTMRKRHVCTFRRSEQTPFQTAYHDSCIKRIRTQQRRRRIFGKTHREHYRQFARSRRPLTRVGLVRARGNFDGPPSPYLNGTSSDNLFANSQYLQMPRRKGRRVAFRFIWISASPLMCLSFECFAFLPDKDRD